MNFYSQWEEDRWIAANVRLPERGVFVEIGAADGRENSNTLHWEERGWSGVVVEPHPRMKPALLANRKCHVILAAAGSEPGVVPFPLHRVPTWSGFARDGCPTVDVRRTTLSEILGECGISHVDLLSIDTEGTELDVWASRPAWLRPSVLVVEHDTAELPSIKDQIRIQIEADGYAVVHETACNFILIPKGT